MRRARSLKVVPTEVVARLYSECDAVGIELNGVESDGYRGYVCSMQVTGVITGFIVQGSLTECSKEITRLGSIENISIDALRKSLKRAFPRALIQKSKVDPIMAYIIMDEINRRRNQNVKI